MNCPKCGGPLTDRTLVCSSCVERMNAAAVRKLQHQPLLLMAEGKGEFITHPTPAGQHVQMFRVKRAFCGSERRARKADQRRMTYHGSGWNYLCPACRDAIEEILIEAREAEAIEKS